MAIPKGPLVLLGSLGNCVIHASSGNLPNVEDGSHQEDDGGSPRVPFFYQDHCTTGLHQEDDGGRLQRGLVRIQLHSGKKKERTTHRTSCQ